MLVLSRKVDETVAAQVAPGVFVEITVVEIRGDKVRLGFTAPTEIPIHRTEVWDSIRAQEEAAA